MSADPLHALAEAAGLVVDWTDAGGRDRRVSPDTLRAVLEATGHHARTATACRDAARAIAARAEDAPALHVVDAGGPIALAGPPGARAHWRRLEGVTGQEAPVEGECRLDRAGAAPAMREPGDYRFEFGGGDVRHVAIAPRRCYGMRDATGELRPRRWGVGLQVYAARHGRDGGLGDAEAARDWVSRIAAAGGDALALSPLHAPGRVHAHFSPYSPSDRRFLDPASAAPGLVLGNAFVADACAAAGLDEDLFRRADAPLVGWPAATALRWRQLRALHARVDGLDAGLRTDLAEFERKRGDALQGHARLAATMLDDAGAGAVALQVFAQWLAARSWQVVQRAARSDGMAVGLVADLAVGVDPAGSEAADGAMLCGLQLGAPADAFNADGQGWGLTTWNPAALVDAGFAPLRTLLRAVLRDRGGVRIDHILGWHRLWVVPAGASPADGVYLRQPLQAMLGLLALESHRARAVVIGEDLGVVPPGLRATLARRGVLGLDVLPFVRDAGGRFLPAARWRRSAVATTTTHDLPPLAGWREAGDVHARAAAAGTDPPVGDLAERAADVAALRATVGHRRVGDVGAAAGADADLDAWTRHVATSPSPLMLLPAEDALGLAGQPNLPGVVDGHPNWRRRLPTPLPEPVLARRFEAVALGRRASTGHPGAHP